MNTGKKLITDVVGIGIIALVVILFIYKLAKTAPNPTEVSAEAKPVEAVDPKLLSSDQITNISKGRKNGVLPIVITDQLPKENPFIKLEQ